MAAEALSGAGFMSPITTGTMSPGHQLPPGTISKAQLISRRKWDATQLALKSQNLEWFQGGGRPEPEDVDPDPTRTHLLPAKPKPGQRFGTRSEMIETRRREHAIASQKQAPTKEASIHAVNLPKLSDELCAQGINWWHHRPWEDGYPKATEHWRPDDGSDVIQGTVVDGGFTIKSAVKKQPSGNTTTLSHSSSAPMIRRRVRVQNGTMREVEYGPDPLKQRSAAAVEEFNASKTHKWAVTAKPIELKQHGGPKPVHSKNQRWSTNVLQYAHLHRTKERFPRPSGVDEFGKSIVWDPTEDEPMYSAFEDPSTRLVFGPGLSQSLARGDEQTFEQYEDEKAPDADQRATRVDLTTGTIIRPSTTDSSTLRFLSSVSFEAPNYRPHTTPAPRVAVQADFETSISRFSTSIMSLSESLSNADLRNRPATGTPQLRALAGLQTASKSSVRSGAFV